MNYADGEPEAAKPDSTQLVTELRTRVHALGEAHGCLTGPVAERKPNVIAFGLVGGDMYAAETPEGLAAVKTVARYHWSVARQPATGLLIGVNVAEVYIGDAYEMLGFTAWMYPTGETLRYSLSGDAIVEAERQEALMSDIGYFDVVPKGTTACLL